MRVTLLSIVGIARLSPLLVIRGPLGRRDLGESNFFSVNKVYLSGGGGGLLRAKYRKTVALLFSFGWDGSTLIDTIK